MKKTPPWEKTWFEVARKEESVNKVEAGEKVTKKEWKAVVIWGAETGRGVTSWSLKRCLGKKINWSLRPSRKQFREISEVLQNVNGLGLEELRNEKGRIEVWYWLFFSSLILQGDFKRKGRKRRETISPEGRCYYPSFCRFGSWCSEQLKYTATKWKGFTSKYGFKTVLKKIPCSVSKGQAFHSYWLIPHPPRLTELSSWGLNGGGGRSGLIQAFFAKQCDMVTYLAASVSASVKAAGLGGLETVFIICIWD